MNFHASFSGTDCSGKSTQIKLLHNHMESLGEKVRVFWYRPGYSREMDWLRSTFRKLSPGSLPIYSEGKKRDAVFSKPGISNAWLLMAFIDAFVQYAIKIRYWRLIGYNVICDRYIQDAVIDLRIRFPSHGKSINRGYNILAFFAPKPAVRFVLSIPETEAILRMEEKNEPFPDSPEVRNLRLLEYKKLVASEGYIVINGIDSVENIHNKIISKLSLQGRD
jgi:thymidylate kinase